MIDDFGPVFSDIFWYVRGLFGDPIFLALVGCALIAWLVTRGPTLRDPPDDPWPRRPDPKR